MTEIPQDIIKAADDVCIALNIPSTVDNCNPIMLALMARDERAAKIADEHALDFEKQADRQSDENIHDSLMRVADGCELVADAIRTHSEK